MKLRRVHHLSDAMEPGDYFVVSDGHIVLCCPKCGLHRHVLADTPPEPATYPIELSPMYSPHKVVSVEPLTLTPSVVCPWNKCHYMVTNGEAQ